MIKHGRVPLAYYRRKLRIISRHPLVITILTFLLTGILANRYLSSLADAARDRELLVIKRQRMADAVKSVSDLIFERVFRGNMVSSSLKRSAPVDELKERKRAYDRSLRLIPLKCQEQSFPHS